MFYMKEHIQAIVTILALVNPVVCAQMFSDCVHDLSTQEKIKQAIKACSGIGIILLVAAVAGTTILKAFGVSLDAFACAGGGILIWLGIGMLKSAQHNSKASASEPSSVSTSLIPLILFAASPGIITGVITIAAAHKHHLFPVTAIVGVIVTLLVLIALFMISIRVFKGPRKQSFGNEMVTSYMGVIVIAMGVQFALSGIKAFMA
jgi:multiple antibiotic resistance protein